MTTNLTMTDLFCGAGGSSTGAVATGGVTVRLAANHWSTAIETHNANHPDTDHLQADISNTDPRYVPSTDLLWASPECTNHSRAKGRKRAPSQPDLFGEVPPDEAAERSRATMWDVVRFTEAHEYRAVLVENVVEVVDWTSTNGRRGGLFDSWLSAMHAMGYRHQIISLNSMHAQAYGLPAPQSRDRVYIVFTREGERAPDFERMQRPRAWCPSCEQLVDAMQTWKRPGTRTGRYRSQYVYRCPKHSCRGQVVEPGWLPALSFIDLTNTGTRIGDRAKPLSEKTMRRIEHGVRRFWHPLLVETVNGYDAADPKHPGHMDPESYWRAWSVLEPVRTQHTGESKGLVLPPALVSTGGQGGDERVRSALDPMRTQTARHEDGVILPPLLMRPYTPRHNPSQMLTSADEPARTMTASTVQGLLYPPFIAELRGGGSTARSATDPLATVTASGTHHGLVMRMNNNGGDDQGSMTTSVMEPARTMTTKGQQAYLSGPPTLDLDDVRFRMLEPGEIKQAMAFPADYVMTGNRREQVKQAGNAVTPPAARDLIATVTAAITGEAVAA